MVFDFVLGKQMWKFTKMLMTNFLSLVEVIRQEAHAPRKITMAYSSSKG